MLQQVKPHFLQQGIVRTPPARSCWNRKSVGPVELPYLQPAPPSLSWLLPLPDVDRNKCAKLLKAFSHVMYTYVARVSV